MASVETHTQFTGSHNDPEAQGTSGGEHLHIRTHTHTYYKCMDTGQMTQKLLVNPRSHSQVICCSSSYDGVERPLGEALARSVVDEGYHDDGALHPGPGQFHQLAGRRMKVRGVCVCTENSYLSLIIFLFFLFSAAASLTMLLLMTKCFGWCVDVMAARLCNCAWLWIVLPRCPVAAKGRPTAVGRVVIQMSLLHNWVDQFLSSFLRQFEL